MSSQQYAPGSLHSYDGTSMLPEQQQCSIVVAVYYRAGVITETVLLRESASGTARAATAMVLRRQRAGPRRAIA